MLKITKDVTIRHDGREIHCKVGQVVNVKASFDINDDVAKGAEIRYADKLRDFCFRVNPTEKSNVVTLQPEAIHNAVEQAKRKESGALAKPVEDKAEERKEELPDDVPDDKPEDKAPDDKLSEEKLSDKPKSDKVSGKKKDEGGKNK